MTKVTRTHPSVRNPDAYSKVYFQNAGILAVKSRGVTYYKEVRRATVIINTDGSYSVSIVNEEDGLTTIHQLGFVYDIGWQEDNKTEYELKFVDENDIPEEKNDQVIRFRK